MNADPDLAVLREDLAVLKRDVASLIEHIKGGATNTVQNVADQIGAEGERSAKAIRVFVDKQPFVALMIAVGIGYIGARALRR